MHRKSIKPESLAAQALGWVDGVTGALAPPIHPSSTFLRNPDNTYASGRSYARADNPSFDQAEALLAELESGVQALLFSSGMAAATVVFQALSPGDHVIAPKVMYWALRNWLTDFARHWGLCVDLVETSDTEAVKQAIHPGRTRLIWLETPANPLWTVTDIRAIADLAHLAHALLVVDSTVATPVLTCPLKLGADIVMHSATKYLNGHSDLIAGALVTREDSEYWRKVTALRIQLGGILGSFEAWLLLRGMRTLFPRVRAASSSAQRIAEHFSGHPRIAEVLYPGLPHAQGHLIAAQQMRGGFGGMLSIRVKGGEAAAIATAAQVELWKRATSLGGVESLIEHRASVEGAGTLVPSDLLRLSVGLEDPDDLTADLEQALEIPT